MIKTQLFTQRTNPFSLGLQSVDMKRNGPRFAMGWTTERYHVEIFLVQDVMKTIKKRRKSKK